MLNHSILRVKSHGFHGFIPSNSPPQLPTCIEHHLRLRGSKIHGLWDGGEKTKQEMYIGDDINIYIKNTYIYNIYNNY